MPSSLAFGRHLLSKGRTRTIAAAGSTRYSISNSIVGGPRFKSTAASEHNPSIMLSQLGIDKLGINQPATIYRNLTYDEIAQHELEHNEGHFTNNNTFAVDTGKFTGRSPKDKWIVKQAPSEDNLWWGNVNQPIDSQVFDDLYKLAIDHYNHNVDEAYVFDGYCGASPNTHKKVRFITELAWQHHFVTNMFIRPDLSKPEVAKDLDHFTPDFTIINACKVVNKDWKKHGLNSDVFVAFNLEKKIAVIGGTWYGGEMKKGIFSMMNYWLPLEGIMPMHCSANIGQERKDTALFFGLSGTGKTTLSADPKRNLIGDDEHGWDDNGIFNFEGGCYAKTINLSEENEPDIYNAIKPNAMLENVHLDPATKEPDYYNVDKTQNGRVSYPLFHIDNFEPTSTGQHPENVIFLTCDAFGVLPPVAKLTEKQAMYHFLSGYTAKVAGTERGISEPEATFSAGFGAAFLTLHPTKYADLLDKKLSKHDTNVYLVNTGWSGGAYGVGERMSIKDTRACIDAILDGSIHNTDFIKDDVFDFKIPTSLPNVSDEVLNPRNAWADKNEYDATRIKLANLFQENYKKYIQPGVTDYSGYGPKL